MNWLVEVLKQASVKALLKKLVVSGGLKTWLITFVVGELVEEADEHLIEPAFVLIGFEADKLDGAKVYKKVNNAKDVNEWLDSLGDVLQLRTCYNKRASTGIRYQHKIHERGKGY